MAAAYSVGHHHCVTRFVTRSSLEACASRVLVCGVHGVWCSSAAIGALLMKQRANESGSGSAIRTTAKVAPRPSRIPTRWPSPWLALLGGNDSPAEWTGLSS